MVEACDPLPRCGFEIDPPYDDDGSCSVLELAETVKGQHARQGVFQTVLEVRVGVEGVEGWFVDGGCVRVDGRAFGEGEERLDVVVVELETVVVPGEDLVQSAALGVFSLGVGVVELDEG